MKNILLATTALVAMTGAAAAEVTLGGRAEVGVVDGTRYGQVTQFHTDVDIDFTLRGEADNGLTFGADLDIDEVPSGLPANDDNGVGYFVAFGGARMDAGDVDGGFDWAMTEVNVAAGSIDDSETWHPGFNGNSGLDGNSIGPGTNDGQIFTFSYTFGDFAAAASVEVEDTGAREETYGLGLKYSGDLGGVTLGVGLGYQTQEDIGDIMGVSVSATLTSGIVFAVNYSEFSPDSAIQTPTFNDTVTHWAVGVGYEMNALAVGINYGEFENALGLGGGYTVGDDSSSSNGFGLAVAYDLGGGLAVQFGAGVGEQTAGGTTTDFDSFSLGLAMSF